jgi:hypothetical protein
MTRGPKPKKAIREAQQAAADRGVVMDATGITGSITDFLVFPPTFVVFVRVKRIRTHITDPQEIEEEFRQEVLQLRQLPLTIVVSREIWVLTPWNKWQYFRILDDRLVEIRCNGSPVSLAGPGPDEKKPPGDPKEGSPSPIGGASSSGSGGLPP